MASACCLFQLRAMNASGAGRHIALTCTALATAVCVCARACVCARTLACVLA